LDVIYNVFNTLSQIGYKINVELLEFISDYDNAFKLGLLFNESDSTHPLPKTKLAKKEWRIHKS